MYELFDKILLFISAMVIYILHDYSLYAVIPAIITILLVPFLLLRELIGSHCTGVWYIFAMCYFIPGYIILLPVLLYDIISRKYQAFSLAVILLFIVNIRQYDLTYFVFTMLIMLGAILLKIKTDKLNSLLTDYNELRDASSSYSQLLEDKNQSILKNQDYEINLATLNERNRISREIHDIGHLLKFCRWCFHHKKKIIHDELSNLKNSFPGYGFIRNGIHNMHDESVDL